ncbi:ATP:cob(I)alamin adenosyltransferase [Bacteroidota bacterium]
MTPNKKLSSKLYTYMGDEGFTKTLHGDNLPKDNCIIEANGDIDSLQAMLDKLIAYSKYSDYVAQQKHLLCRIQTLLWQLGGEVSQQDVGGKVNQPIEQVDVEDLEKAIDLFKLNLKSFQRFSHLIAIDVNETRVRTRKLERTLTIYLREFNLRPVVYKYINRLSDYFFALAVKIQQEDKDL